MSSVIIELNLVCLSAILGEIKSVDAAARVSLRNDWLLLFLKVNSFKLKTDSPMILFVGD